MTQYVGWSSGEATAKEVCRQGEAACAPAEAGREKDGFAERANHEALTKITGHKLDGEEAGFVCLSHVLYVR